MKNFVAGDTRNINMVVGAGIIAGQPIAVGNITGTAYKAADSDNKAVVDVSPVATYKHDVRNVLTYATGAEDTFTAIADGTDIYLDNSSTMPTGVFLSCSPLDEAGVAQKKFGKAVGGLDSTATVNTATDVEVIQDRA